MDTANLRNRIGGIMEKKVYQREIIYQPISRIFVLLIAVTFSVAAHAVSVPVTFTKLTGLTGGSPAETAVYRADLSTAGIADILSVSIRDNSGGFGGAAGQFSGFDLDAIVLSTTLCTDASCAAGLTGLPVFDFSTAGTIFNEGSQRPPVDPKLFGTDATGSNVDNTVATLGFFDANSTTAIPGADGFVSMGDFGQLFFNLTSSTSTTGLYLYIGEVGDNGEVAGSSIEISDAPTVPIPAAVWLFGTGLLGLVGMARRKAA